MLLLFAQDGELSPLTAALIITVALLLGRYLWLRSQRTPDMMRPPTTLPVPVTPLLPSSGGSWFWPSRKGRIEQDTELVVAHTDLLLAKIKQVEATGSFLLALRQLATILAELKQPTPAVARDFSSRSALSLTLNEIDEMVAALPDIPPQLRTALMNLLRGRLAEKAGQ